MDNSRCHSYDSSNSISKKSKDVENVSEFLSLLVVKVVATLVAMDTHQACTVYTECRSEVSCFMEVVLEAVAQRVAICAYKICLHFGFTYHTISAK